MPFGTSPTSDELPQPLDRVVQVLAELGFAVTSFQIESRIDSMAPVSIRMTLDMYVGSGGLGRVPLPPPTQVQIDPGVRRLFATKEEV